MFDSLFYENIMNHFKCRALVAYPSSSTFIYSDPLNNTYYNNNNNNNNEDEKRVDIINTKLNQEHLK